MLIIHQTGHEIDNKSKEAVRKVPDKTIEKIETPRSPEKKVTRTYPENKVKENNKSGNSGTVKETSTTKKITSGTVIKKESSKEGKAVSGNEGVKKSTPQNRVKKTVTKQSDSAVKNSSKSNTSKKR